jgi:hypothetical protein
MIPMKLASILRVVLPFLDINERQAIEDHFELNWIENCYMLLGNDRVEVLSESLKKFVVLINAMVVHAIN